MLKDNNDIIYENSNGEITMNYKNIETQIIEHNNCHKSVSIKNSDDSVISDRRVKMQNNQEDYTVDIYTEPNGKISSILSDNQTIKFLQNEYNMTDVEYNNSIIIKNIKENDSLVRKYINGGSVLHKQNNCGYNVSIDKTIDYEVHDGNNFEEIEWNNNKIIFRYDEDGKMVSKEYNEVMYLIDNECKTFVSLDGKSLSYTTKKEDGDIVFYLQNKEIYRKSDQGDIQINGNNIIKNEYDSKKMLVSRKYFGSIEKFKYNSLGYIETIETKDSKKNYMYDGLGRLVSSNCESSVNEYSYDLYGNIIHDNEHTYIYDDKGRLELFDNERFTYDELGNAISWGKRKFEWSGGTLLSKYSDDDTITKYEYDISGTRTSKTINGETKHYFYDGKNLISTYTNNDKIFYLYDDEDNIFGFLYNDSVYYYGINVNGIIECIYDENINEVVRYQYDDWGKLLKVFDISKDKVSQKNDIIYKSYVYDFDSDMYYLNYRYYNPSIKRFFSIDNMEKIEAIGSKDYAYNLYAYCINNPIMMADPSGAELILSFSSFALVVCTVIGVSVALLTVYYIAKYISEIFFNAGVIDVWDDKWEKYIDSLAELLMEIKKGVNLAIGEFLFTIWMWWNNNKAPQHHHIVAKNDKRAFEKPYVIKFCGSIDDDRNMVWLKYRFHKHLHTNAYHYAVNSTLFAARSIAKSKGLSEKYEFLSCLETIKRTLISFNDSLPF